MEKYEQIERTNRELSAIKSVVVLAAQRHVINNLSIGSLQATKLNRPFRKIFPYTVEGTDGLILLDIKLEVKKKPVPKKKKTKKSTKK